MSNEGRCVVCKEGPTGWRAYGHFCHPRCAEDVIRFVVGRNEIKEKMLEIADRYERWLAQIVLDESNVWVDPQGDRWIFHTENAQWHFRYEHDSVHSKLYPSLDAAKIELARFIRL